MRERYCDPVRRARRKIAWGVALVIGGGVFLADRMGLLDLGPVWHYWPFLIVLGGLIDLLTARRWSHVISGLFGIVVGTWIYACLEHLWGLTFANSWPIVLISIGATTLAEGLTRRKSGRDEEIAP